MPHSFLLSLCLLLTGLLGAQDLYTVRVGSFQDVKSADFDAIADRGFIYGAPRGNRVTEVFLGNYATETKANQVATDLVAEGFRNAQAFALPTAEGQAVTMIQLGLYGKGREPDWEALNQVGELYVESVGGTRKVMTGLYPSPEAAKAALPAIRQMGYQDAFVKNINNVRLIPVRAFETGIKRALIPLELQQANPTVAARGPATTTSAPAAAPTDPPAPATYSTNISLPSTATATTAVVNPPSIDGRTRRTAAAELQKVLKERDYYQGAIDGLYGSGTERAYEAAWEDMPELLKYRALTPLLFTSAQPASGVIRWPEVEVLLTVAQDLAAGMQNAERDAQLARQRPALLTSTTPLTPAAASRVRAWNATIWENLTNWAREDPLHARILSALRVSYYQSQVRLENHYTQQGLSKQDAEVMALAMLQNMVGAQLDRFL